MRFLALNGLVAIILSGIVSLSVVFAQSGKGDKKHIKLKMAIFSGGCFWCIESDFESVTGVHTVESGFTGGDDSKPPIYKNSGDHLEAVKILFDPMVVSYNDLLHKFFRSVDPTDPNGQFCDRGATYATAIFYVSSQQKAAAMAAKVQAMLDLKQDIVTPIRNASTFYNSSSYHQDFYKSNRIIFTRFGFLSKAKAYKKYREACGRDARVKDLWGAAAAFLH